MLDAGDPAPDFDLPRPAADGRETYRLSAAAREGPVVLAFYPVADADAAAGLLGDLAGVDWASVTDRVAVLAVGVGERAEGDPVPGEADAPFPVLRDRDGFFAERYGLLEPAAGDAIRVRPAVFVVGRDCFVRGAWAADEGDGSVSIDAVTSALASR